MPLRRGVGKRQQRAGMPGRERAGRQIGANLLGQFQQPHEVGDRTAVLADSRGDLLLRQRELVGEPLIRQRLVDRIESFALKVLDQRELEQLLVTVGDIADDDRNACRPARCAARQRRSPAMIR